MWCDVFLNFEHERTFKVMLYACARAIVSLIYPQRFLCNAYVMTQTDRQAATHFCFRIRGQAQQLLFSLVGRGLHRNRRAAGSSPAKALQFHFCIYSRLVFVYTSSHTLHSRSSSTTGVCGSVGRATATESQGCWFKSRRTQLLSVGF